jgi:hypothetical protein
VYKRWGVPTLILLIVCLAFISANCDQLVPKSDEDTVNEAWISRYDGQTEDDDGGQALTIDGIGNIFVTGYSWGTDSSSDYATMKYDPAGNQLWVNGFDYG